MTSRIINVPHNSSRVVAPSAILRASVGPGYVVVVRLAGSAGGGLVHLKANPNHGDVLENYRETEQQLNVLEQFVKKLKRLDSTLNGATAEITGGADVLRLLPFGAREAAAEERMKIFCSFLTRYNIEVEATDVGGTKGRTVFLELEHSSTAADHLASVQQTGEIAPVPLNSLIPRPSFTPSQLQNAKVFTVNAGDLLIDAAPSQFVAILGSCVGVALWDPKSRIGGMIHVMMPSCQGECREPSRYADRAVHLLAKKLVEAGATSGRFIAAVAGGASVLNIGRTFHDFKIGARNAEHVTQALRELRIPIKHEETGGVRGRKIWVNLRNFSVRINDLPGSGSVSGHAARSR